MTPGHCLLASHNKKLFASLFPFGQPQTQGHGQAESSSTQKGISFDRAAMTGPRGIEGLETPMEFLEIQVLGLGEIVAF